MDIIADDFISETGREGYRLVWVHNSSKESQDCHMRAPRIAQAEDSLTQLSKRLKRTHSRAGS